MTRIGTSYFVNLAAACRYFKPYGYDAADVTRKLAEGEIHLGKPPVMKGEVLGGPVGTGARTRPGLRLTDGGTRYEIEIED